METLFKCDFMWFSLLILTLLVAKFILLFLFNGPDKKGPGVPLKYSYFGFKLNKYFKLIPGFNGFMICLFNKTKSNICKFEEA